MISDFPLFVFTLFGGLSIGLVCANALFPSEGQRKAWVLPGAALVLMAVGLLGCLFHLGHPERFMTALANPTAGIAQEAYGSIVFCVLLVVETLVAFRKGSVPRPLAIVTALAGVVLAVIMGVTYQSFQGVVAWLTPFALPLFLCGDLFAGAAFYGLFDRKLFAEKGFTTYAWVLAALCAITFIGLAVHNFGLGLDGVLYLVALVVGPVAGSITTFLAKKDPSMRNAVLTFVLVALGVMLSRWAFYAGNIF